MPEREPTDPSASSSDQLGAHPAMRSKLDLTAEDRKAVENHAEALDTRLFGAPIKQTLAEQSAEIASTMKRIFARTS